MGTISNGTAPSDPFAGRYQRTLCSDIRRRLNQLEVSVIELGPARVRSTHACVDMHACNTGLKGGLRVLDPGNRSTHESLFGSGSIQQMIPVMREVMRREAESIMAKR